jgi:predicted DNA binding CopG/RHH family protein
MKRITVDFEDALHLKLKIQCAKEGIPITDLIRRLVEQYLKAEKKLK